MQTTLFLIQDTVLTPTTINTITCETRALLTDEKRSESGESQFGQENHSTIIFSSYRLLIGIVHSLSDHYIYN